MNEQIDLDDLISVMSAACTDAFAEIGRFNLIVFGDSGAGKTTLINSFFGMNLGETGIGNAVTPYIRRCQRNEDDIITIYDNRGFEVGRDNLDDIISDLNKVITASRIGPQEDRIHAAWFVVNTLTSRFLDTHMSVIEAMHKLDLPVILVLTHVHRLGDQIDERALKLAEHIESRKLPLSADGRILMVNSLPTKQLGGPEIPQHGLFELLQATLEIAPAAAKAIKAGQRLDFSLQRSEAKRIIKNFRYISAGAGLTAAAPIPATDVVAVTTAIAVMLVKISVCYALPIQKGHIVTIAGATVLGVGATQQGARVVGEQIATMAGEKLVNEAAKRAAKEAVKEAGEQLAKEVGKATVKQSGKQVARFVPVLNIIVGAVAAGAALTLATAVGHAWMYVCEFLLRHPKLLATLETPMVLRLFTHFYRRKGSTPPGEGSDPIEPML
ncbi:DUF697 domain-containing protein [Acrocarpospora sp. B8E8]|uniref:DUF697 domain-containing protein n=1 Tax=Acrocarpospora sp. B8E8 TaxID=3153572 RepID=UPI00325EBC20